MFSKAVLKIDTMLIRPPAVSEICGIQASQWKDGGRVGTGIIDQSAGTPIDLARLTQTVCMTPRAKASQGVLRKRSEGFRLGRGFNHCPHEANWNVKGSTISFELSEAQRSLL